MVGWHHRLNGHEFGLASLSITGKPGMLQSMGSQRVGDSWATELSLTFGMACIHLACHKMDTPRHLPWAGWGGKSNENYGNVVKCNSFVGEMNSAQFFSHLPLAADGICSVEPACKGQSELLLHSPLSLTVTKTELRAVEEEARPSVQCLENGKSCFSGAQRSEVLELNEAGMSCLMNYFDFSWLRGETGLRDW